VEANDRRAKGMRDIAGQDPETELIGRYREGDAAALGVLVERYRRPLFGFIANMTRDGADADEVFQEVWFKAIRKLALYKERNFGGWLMRIAHNIVIDHARRRKGMCSLDAGDSGGTLAAIIPAPGHDPAGHAQAGELGRRITDAVATLPPEQKAVFLMRVEMGLPFREISRIQRVPLNTALARMHYAVCKLRTILRDDYKSLAAQRPAATSTV
jgi:RNA polymerase sigma-70 factor (ECF subfamily)